MPIVAYDSCAIGETLGGSGLLLPEKDPAVAAEAINLIMEDRELREKLIMGQRKRLEDFQHDKIKEQFLNAIRRFTEGEKL